jgi:hypothetical protein
MTSWPDNWKNRVLDTVGIPVTPTAMKILTAWRKSTPLDPWTNNPLGMPASAGRTGIVPNTRYAAFASIGEFYAALGLALRSSQGQEVVAALAGADGYGPAWRAVAALGWPAGLTETDYPAAVLDLAEQAYRESVQTTDPSARKTSGRPRAPAGVQAAMIEQARSVNQAASSISDAGKAVRYLIGRHARNGR